MKKRKNECLFCTSRSCHAKIISENYEEIACSKHAKNLERHAREVRGIYRSSTGKMSRGENWFEAKASFDKGIEEIENYKK